MLFRSDVLPSESVGSDDLVRQGVGSYHVRSCATNALQILLFVVELWSAGHSRRPAADLIPPLLLLLLQLSLLSQVMEAHSSSSLFRWLRFRELSSRRRWAGRRRRVRFQCTGTESLSRCAPTGSLSFLLSELRSWLTPTATNTPPRAGVKEGDRGCARFAFPRISGPFLLLPPSLPASPPTKLPLSRSARPRRRCSKGAPCDWLTPRRQIGRAHV